MATPKQLSVYGTMSRPLAGGLSLAVISGVLADKWPISAIAEWPLAWSFLASVLLFAFVSIGSSALIYVLFFSRGRKEFRPQQVLSIGLKTAIDVTTCVLLFGSLTLVEQLSTVVFANRNFDYAEIFVTLPILMTAWVAANFAIRFTVRLLLSRARLEAAE